MGFGEAIETGRRDQGGAESINLGAGLTDVKIDSV